MTVTKIISNATLINAKTATVAIAKASELRRRGWYAGRAEAERVAVGAYAVATTGAGGAAAAPKPGKT